MEIEMTVKRRNTIVIICILHTWRTLTRYQSASLDWGCWWWWWIWWWWVSVHSIFRRQRKWTGVFRDDQTNFTV